MKYPLKINFIKLSKWTWLIEVCFLLSLFLVFYKITGGFFKNIYDISNLENKYFSITLTDNGPKYHETDEIPAKWIPLKSISKKAIGAIVVSEDGKFYLHHGYDIEQIQKVMALKFIAKKKKVRGASTITQQLIKNLYLSKEKSLSRKIKEFYLADYIEDKVSKEKILEIYLNIIEYGKGIYGIENAAKYYFNKSAKNLNGKEGAFLAMLLPSPIRYAKSFKQKSLTPFAISIVDSILLKMQQSNYLSLEEYHNLLKTPLSFEKYSLTQVGTIQENLATENESEGESDEQEI